MIDIQEKKKKIISFIKENGPSLPVRIAKTIEMDPVFASAILSELLNAKEIKMSHLKVGSSSLYLIPGQEQSLEEYTENLKPIEKDALIKLQKNKILTDEDEEPATRVALRNIKDFATPFRFQEKIMWRYNFTPDEEIRSMLSTQEKKKEEIKERSVQETKEATEEEAEEENVPKAWEIKKEEIKKAKVESKKIESIFEEEEDKPQPEFLKEVKDFLEQKNIEFIEEIRTEKKEIMAKVEIASQLGNICFLLIAKNKKTITKNELEASIQIATKNNMPCLLLIRKEPSKSLNKIIEENHLIKLEILE